VPGEDGIAPVHQRAGIRYALGVAAGAAAVWGSHAVIPLLGGPFFFFVFPAVLGVALVGGTGPGLACAATYAACAAWLFFPPPLLASDGRAALRLVLLTASAGLVAAVGGRLRSTLARERRLRERLQQENAARAAAEEALRQAHDRLAAVQGLTASLSAAHASEEVADAVFRQAFPLVGARAGSICFPAAGDRLEMRFSEAFADDARRDFHIVPLDAPVPTAEAARTGRAVWLGSVAEIERRYPHLAGARARWGDRAWACVPLRVEDDAMGVLGLSFREERAFDAVERAFVASIAQLCAQAFSRARRHEAEQEARRRAEAAEDVARRTAALQDQVLAVVGHDLRTPLSAIIMAAGVAQQRALAEEGLAAPLARISRSARRMNEIIRDLLDVARARQGLGLTLTRRWVSADEICAQAVAELEQVHPDRTVRLSASGDLRLEADPSRLLQAISNLVGNALQHGAPDRDVAVLVAGGPDAVTVRVRNGGSPIPADAVDELFEPFRRGSKAGEGGDSLGLGLFIVREIARAHGGTVSVASDDGGTTFELRLPRDPAGPAAAAGSPG
jgi:signal transduction histidine kinase